MRGFLITAMKSIPKFDANQSLRHVLKPNFVDATE